MNDYMGTGNRCSVLIDNAGVELSTESGTQLGIVENGASISFPIPEKLESRAVSRIPLWLFDESEGIWAEVGEALREGDMYVAEVDHFSSYNLDFKTDPIDISGQVLWDTDDGAIGSSYLRIYARSESIGSYGGWLSEDGMFRFYNFPKDKAFELTIINECWEQAFTGQYGPFSEDTTIDPISISSTGTDIIVISGRAINCDSSAVEEGRIIAQGNHASIILPIESDGNFSYVLDACQNQQYSLTLLDLSSNLTKVLELEPQSANIDLGDLVVCVDPNDFVTFNIGDDEIITLSPGVLFQNHLVVIEPSGQTVPTIGINYWEGAFETQRSFEMEVNTPGSEPFIRIIKYLTYSPYEPNTFYGAGRDHFELTIEKYDNRSGGCWVGSFAGTIFKSVHGTRVDTLPLIGNFVVPIH